jgi:hypothetical protein
MAILKYSSKAKKAVLKQGFSQELKSSLVYEVEEPEDFSKYMKLCMKMDYRIQAHATLTKYSAISSAACPNLPAPRATIHLTNTNSGRYGPTPMDLSASQKS